MGVVLRPLTVLVLVTLVALFGVVACERPPVGDGDPDLVEGRPLDPQVADTGVVVVPAVDVVGAAPQPGATRRWDLGVVASADGPRVLHSSAAAAAALAAADPPFIP